ncbi:UDP-3-O-acylglucosamine N-acyltransferase [Commensalibacter sp. Nvir]|uniref:UDP-3-O-(3-hydroxymyristoyl)glucosamine N-acyltransferase n=1 Tax=Commensalibacter sp. Nvir TaxID=3069817 RepID=UPI002D3D4159|nr:UDP-3-O-acylglucosamine N-acyltransferase [Commensalibacter sp. Nvir]
MNNNLKTNQPADPRFFHKSGFFSLEQLAEITGASILPALSQQNKENVYTGIAPLQLASYSEVSFLDNKKYLPLLTETKAGIVIISPAFKDKVPNRCNALTCKNPYLAWAKVATLFYPKIPAKAGIHPTAYIHPDSEVDPSAEIEPFVVIMSGVKIGKNTIVGSHSVIERNVEIGNHCRIGSHVSISHAIVGNRVTLFPGARIGQDGFGFAVGEKGFVSIPQIGKVILEDDVEIGANSTVDRGSVCNTIIGQGSRLDNLVQIGHNVQMGKCCIVVSQAGISGSTQLGDFVTIAAQAGLIGHIHIGDHARIGAQCGVMSDVDAKSDVIGSPAMPFREFFKNVAFLRRLAKSGSIKDSQ